MSKLQWVKLIVLLAVPALGALYAYQFTNQARELITPFKPVQLPAGPVKGYDGEWSRIKLSEPVTLVNFWATWCPPCVEEFPAMLELQRRLGEEGLEILFVSVDENWEDVEGFFATHGLEVPPERLFWDPERLLAEKWGAEKFPESFVLRQDFWAVEKIIGLQQWTSPGVVKYFSDLTTKFGEMDLELDVAAQNR